jgi:hypothetical protein
MVCLLEFIIVTRVERLVYEKIFHEFTVVGGGKMVQDSHSSRKYV